jgi:hypothetical protein
MMAKQPEDTSTTDLFDSALSENVGHTLQFGKTGAGKTMWSAAESVSRIRTFRARRKLFPSDGTSRDTAACELCGTRHRDPSKRTRWGGK